ncbi:MAG: ferrous iron transport protein B [Abditibacteriales bacterium]|nr:ferrous iron transport protein B [Abditibacteriales bacterium]MDW8364683.1 ferrous iron transport protein B [Abditibacteriales bacterium]
MTTDAALKTRPASLTPRPQLVALVGNPNAGKTTVFNKLTGLRQKVANYPGVTVEKKEGRCTLPDGSSVTVLDLPGAYSLTSRSPDEDIVRDVLLGLRDDTPRPDVVVVVVDASNLERNLYLVTQVMELGLPVIVALNMLDTAEAHGRAVNAKILAAKLGVPVVPLIAHKGQGMDDLRAQLTTMPPLPQQRVPLPPALRTATNQLKERLQKDLGIDEVWAHALALRMLVSDSATEAVQQRWGNNWLPIVESVRSCLGTGDVDTIHAEATERYRWINEVCRDAMSVPKEARLTLTERLDRVLTHRLFGPVIFLVLMLIVFQSIFSWAQLPMDAIDGAMRWLGGRVAAVLPDGALRSLLVDGVIAGAGAVVVFLPQILFLFFFLALLDDSGYLARAAFLMDKLMSSVGLHGRSFIPLMSSFACAIPGIMATRTIENKRDRFLTILIAPLMSCSARLPVYTLMIGAFIPNKRVLGFISLPALTLFSMYILGVLAAMGVGWLFRRTLFKGQPSPFLLELPPYRLPVLRNVLITLWERAREFLYRAGTIILAISMILWFLVSYPQRAPLANETKEQAAGEQIRHSYAGRLGRLIEPVVRPLGFDWKIGIGLIGSFAAREVLVSTLATVYNVGEADETSVGLREALRREKYPDGRPVYTPLVAVSLMVFFVLACQCMSTVAIVRRETNSWGWAAFMVAYMTALAYLGSLTVYQGGRLLGWG